MRAGAAQRGERRTRRRAKHARGTPPGGGGVRKGAPGAREASGREQDSMPSWSSNDRAGIDELIGAWAPQTGAASGIGARATLIRPIASGTPVSGRAARQLRRELDAEPARQCGRDARHRHHAEIAHARHIRSHHHQRRLHLGTCRIEPCPPRVAAGMSSDCVLWSSRTPGAS